MARAHSVCAGSAVASTAATHANATRSKSQNIASSNDLLSHARRPFFLVAANRLQSATSLPSYFASFNRLLAKY